MTNAIPTRLNSPSQCSSLGSAIMTAQQHATEFVDSYFDAWNQHDANGVAGHLSEHGIYCDISWQEQHNRQQFRAILDEFFANDSQHYHLIGEVLTGESTIAFQYRVSVPHCATEHDWFGAEFITMQGDVAGNISDFYPKANTILRYAKSGLDPSQLDVLSRQLELLMDRDRPYLSGNLTLPQLAAKLGCSVNHLSQVINSEFRLSFFDFINGYRVRNAIELLHSSAMAEEAVLNIALAAGFNSTSTFYAAFKKHTGQTPAQCRKAHLS
jgi:AraC-like DNA-binding protein